MILFLDVETIPSQAPDALKLVRAGIKPPGTLKKAESIAAWWQTEADAAAAEAHRKQSLGGGTLGELVSIAACTETEGQHWVRCRAPGEPEAELLSSFFAEVEAWIDAEAALCVGNPHAWPVDLWPVAHNAAFDLGYLWRRAIVCRVPMPDWLPGPMARAGKEYGDSMSSWAGYGGRVSLDALCRALGVTSPKDGDLDGAGVYDAWTAGEAPATQHGSLVLPRSGAPLLIRHCEV